MKDKTYDILNKIQRWLPLVGVLYLTICNIWHLPYGDEVNQTIVAVATFLAGTLEIANSVYLINEKKRSDLIGASVEVELPIIDFDAESESDLDE